MFKILVLLLILVPSVANAGASIVPAFACISSTSGKVCSGQTGTNTLQIVGGTTSKISGRPTFTATPAFGKWSSAGGSVDAAKQNINTMQVVGATFSKPGGKPTMTIANAMVLDVKDPRFAGGAKCDGVTADTAAFQAAVDYTGTLPRGAELSISGLCVVGHITINNPGLSSVMFNGHGTAKLLLAPGTNADMFTIAATSTAPTFKDIALDGNKANQSGTSHGINCPTATGLGTYLPSVNLHNVRVVNFLTDNIHIEFYRSLSTLESVTSTGAGRDCFFADSVDHYVTNSHFGSCGANTLHLNRVTFFSRNTDYWGSAWSVVKIESGAQQVDIAGGQIAGGQKHGLEVVPADIGATAQSIHVAAFFQNNGLANLTNNTTSASSLTIGTGAQTLTVGTGLGFTGGQAVTVAKKGGIWMQGTVTSYNTDTGVLVVNVTASLGAGTFTSWGVATNNPLYDNAHIDSAAVNLSGSTFSDINDSTGYIPSARYHIWTNGLTSPLMAWPVYLDQNSRISGNTSDPTVIDENSNIKTSVSRLKNTSNTGYGVWSTNSSDLALRATVFGESNARMYITTDGHFQVGPGTGVVDLDWHRYAVGVWGMLAGNSLRIDNGGALRIQNTGGAENYLWTDSYNQLRIHTVAPSNRASDGVPIGTPRPIAYGSIGAVTTAGTYLYCTDCTTAATCVGGGTGHMAVSNGTNWTCQ